MYPVRVCRQLSIVVGAAAEALLLAAEVTLFSRLCTLAACAPLLPTLLARVADAAAAAAVAAANEVPSFSGAARRRMRLCVYY